MKIQEFTHEGIGMTRVYENAKWTVGIKNWKPENDISGLTCIERHNKTDELFVLLEGECTLLYATEHDGELKYETVRMQPGKVYNIPATLWHNTITKKNTKLVLIEDSATGSANSDVLSLSEEQINSIKNII